VYSIVVEMWSGGGGGGDGALYPNCTPCVTCPEQTYSAPAGGSGGSGSYIKKNLQVTPGSGYNVMVGQGGLAGIGGLNGSSGGASIFGSLIITGGQGGTAGSIVPNPPNCTPTSNNGSGGVGGNGGIAACSDCIYINGLNGTNGNSGNTSACISFPCNLGGVAPITNNLLNNYSFFSQSLAKGGNGGDGDHYVGGVILPPCAGGGCVSGTPPTNGQNGLVIIYY
jgi:hypothetical protein